jgi:hypothetical protein
VVANAAIASGSDTAVQKSIPPDMEAVIESSESHMRNMRSVKFMIETEPQEMMMGIACRRTSHPPQGLDHQVSFLSITFFAALFCEHYTVKWEKMNMYYFSSQSYDCGSVNVTLLESSLAIFPFFVIIT